MRAAVILSKVCNFSKIILPHFAVYNFLAIQTYLKLISTYKTFIEIYLCSRKLNVYLYTAFLGEKGP